MVRGKKAKKQIQNLRQKKSPNYSTHLKWQIFKARQIFQTNNTQFLKGTLHFVVFQDALHLREDCLHPSKTYCKCCRGIAFIGFVKKEHHILWKNATCLSEQRFILKIITCPKNNFKMLKLAIFDHWMLERAYPFNEPVRRKQHFLQAALHFQKGQLTGRWCKFQKSADISCRMIVSAMISLFFLSGK